MKKRKLFLAGVCLSMLFGVQVKAEAMENVELKASDAEVSGIGYDQNGEEVESGYNESLGVITQVGDNTEVVFDVPDGVEGTYDVYLELGKSPYAAGTTYVGITVGDAREYVPIIPIQYCNETYSDINELGLFVVDKAVEVEAGEKITVSYKPGYTMEWGGTMSCALPPMGNMYLYEAGSAVAVGYGDDASVPQENNADADEADPISGKTIVWLGSSVTFGDNGYSMAETVAENHSAVSTYKYAISGTMLTNTSDSSYVERMKEIDPNMDIDAFVVQLSTNDATNGMPLGEISDSDEYDDTTIVGAMETIISYVKSTWDCPVVFYTGTYFESDEYQAMVDKLFELKDKWDIDVVDLWNNEKLKDMCLSGEINSYMKTKYGTENEPDPIHPNATGYKELWTPVFEETLSEILK